MARLDGTRPGPTLTLMGHLDVVPADAGEWSVPPFAGVVKDGFVWGCGATDMKNQVAAEAVAAGAPQALAAPTSPAPSSSPPPPTRRTASTAASRWLCEHRPEPLRCDYLLNEGMGGLWLPVDGTKVFLLAVGEKAFAQFRIRTRGRGGHGSVPEKEHSAVIDLARAVTALGLADPPAIVSAHDGAVHRRRSCPTRRCAARLKDPPHGARRRRRAARGCDPVVAGLVEPLLGATFTPTVLDAGKAVNVIPTHAEAVHRLPHPAGDDAATTPGATSRAVLDPLGIEWEFEWVDVTDAQRLARAHAAQREHRARAAPRRARAPCWRRCARAASPTRAGCAKRFPDCVAYGFAPFLAESFHAMDGGRDHEPDERIMVEDVTYQALFFERLARDLLA